MLTSERIEEIQSRSRADYACLDAPGFRDSLAARRDVAALLEDRAELVAENERLREALRMCREYIGTGNATADYEVAAERFRRDTHMMAPGKSEPSGFVSRYTYDQRQMAWQAWLEQRKEAVILALCAWKEGK